MSRGKRQKGTPSRSSSFSSSPRYERCAASFVRGKSPSSQGAKGFTLIELLVVIAILGVLATAVVLVLNPAELLAQGRDSTRLSDLASLNGALSLFTTDAYTQSIGTSSVVYVSIPDTSPTCANLGLPALPTGWTYGCASTSTYTKVNGTGWIPVNFNLISSGSPLSKLPIDPTNTTSSGLYYTYATNGSSYQMTAHMESQKYISIEASSGGDDLAMYKIGSNIDIAPFAGGLVGYWPMDNASGATSTDSSGSGNDGSLCGFSGCPGTGSPTWTTGKINGALSFNGTTAYVNVANSANLNVLGPLTISAWVYPLSQSFTYPGIVYKGYLLDLANYAPLFRINAGVTAVHQIPQSTWTLITGVYDGSTMKVYINQNKDNSINVAAQSGSSSGALNIGVQGRQYFNGSIDDVRIYNRALSAAEIAAIYNAQK